MQVNVEIVNGEFSKDIFMMKIVILGFFIKEDIILQELSYLPCALPYRFIFSSETDSMTLGESEKTGAIFWVMVG